MVLVTVRNTGSHFALDLFERGAFNRHDSLWEPPTGNDLWFSHAESEKLPRIREKILESPPLVMTMRHPMKVAESWIKRQKALGQWFRQMWVNLFTLKEEWGDSYWMPIDTRDRDTRLSLIADRLNLDLETDWTPKGVTGNNWPWTSGMTLDEAREFFKTLPFDQFGYEL